MKKIICILICIFMLIPTFTSCSKPPEYADIEERFKELVSASGEINEIFFGEGLPTYKRVYDDLSTFVGENGSYYYYELEDDTYGMMYAFRPMENYGKDFTYLQILDAPDGNRTPYYENSGLGIYAYVIKGYVEPEYIFYYDSADPTDYDYVRFDCEYQKIEDIKAAAEQVYSSDLLKSIYVSMFDGTEAITSGVSGLSARYTVYTDANGENYLMKSNRFDPFITEIREFDFSTAQIVEKESNAEFVVISIQSYLPSEPDKRDDDRLTMILENGVWMLDSATY